MDDTDANLRRNHDLVRRWVELFSGKDPTDADRIAGHRYVEHAMAPFAANEPGEVVGPAHLRASVTWLRDQFPDIEMTIESIVAEGDAVAVRVASRGTNLGPINGVIPPTGAPFSSRQSHWFRIHDGRLVEHWATRDDLTTMFQLGLVPGPGRPPSTASAGVEHPDPRPDGGR